MKCSWRSLATQATLSQYQGKVACLKYANMMTQQKSVILISIPSLRQLGGAQLSLYPPKRGKPVEQDFQTRSLL